MATWPLTVINVWQRVRNPSGNFCLWQLARDSLWRHYRDVRGGQKLDDIWSKSDKFKIFLRTIFSTFWPSEPKCTKTYLKVLDLFHFGTIWPNLGPTFTSLLWVMTSYYCLWFVMFITIWLLSIKKVIGRVVMLISYVTWHPLSHSFVLTFVFVC